RRTRSRLISPSPRKEAGVVSLREQVGDEDEGCRHGQRSHGLAGAERADRAVARATAARGLPVDLKNAIEDVDDPVVLDAVAGVEGRLPRSIEGEPGLRDLHDEHRPDRMALAVVTGCTMYQ